jgi:tRNA 2-selenouridine synthase SelU
LQEYDQLLQSPFNFYSLSLSLNEDQQIDIASRTTTRYLQYQLNRMSEEKEGMLAELEALRKLMAEFKKNSEDAARRIREYELREQIALNENQTIRDLYKKRVERISQDYIKFIEKREAEFQRFQAYAAYEIDTNVCCNEGL